MGLSASKVASTASMEFVKSSVSSNKVVMFSKSYCPYCTKAKKALAQFLKSDQYHLIEVRPSRALASLLPLLPLATSNLSACLLSAK
jgi:hypothetical protein